MQARLAVRAVGCSSDLGYVWGLGSQGTHSSACCSCQREGWEPEKHSRAGELVTRRPRA